MADGAAVLAAQIKRLRELGDLTRDVAPEVAKTLERTLAAQVAAGVGPDGAALKPTKEGKEPLRGAARALRVRAIGSVVVATLEGHYALHHQGRARGGVRRPILPSGSVPAPVVKAITETVTKRFRATMGGR